MATLLGIGGGYRGGPLIELLSVVSVTNMRYGHTLSRVLSHRTLEREEDRQEETKVFQKNWVKTKMGWHSLNSTDDMNTSIREAIKYFLAEFFHQGGNIWHHYLPHTPTPLVEKRQRIT